MCGKKAHSSRGTPFFKAIVLQSGKALFTSPSRLSLVVCVRVLSRGREKEEEEVVGATMASYPGVATRLVTKELIGKLNGGKVSSLFQFNASDLWFSIFSAPRPAPPNTQT